MSTDAKLRKSECTINVKFLREEKKDHDITSFNFWNSCLLALHTCLFSAWLVSTISNWQWCRCDLAFMYVLLVLVCSAEWPCIHVLIKRPVKWALKPLPTWNRPAFRLACPARCPMKSLRSCLCYACYIGCHSIILAAASVSFLTQVDVYCKSGSFCASGIFYIFYCF